MTAKVVHKLQLPAGLSPQGEAEWWDRHRDYWDTVASGDEVLDAVAVRCSELVTLRLGQRQGEPAAALPADLWPATTEKLAEEPPQLLL